MKHTIEIRTPDDWHVHLRDGDMLRAVLAATSNVFARALVMPNIDPPVVDADQALAYRERIVLALDKVGDHAFQPMMTIKLTPSTTKGMIVNAVAVGVLAAKLYPDRPPGKVGAEMTTNAVGGIYDYDLDGHFGDTLRVMQTEGMVLCVHAEMPDIFVMDREAKFLGAYIGDWAEAFPRLRIVIEHATTKEALDLARKWDRVACSITAHHLVMTLDDVVGGRISPHNFCKPVAKTPEDRQALIVAATSGDPSFFFGSDSAPHLRNTKEAYSGSAGCFTAPVALPLLAGVFEDAGALGKLEAFVSENGARFYGVPLNERMLILTQEVWSGTDANPTNINVTAFGIERTFRWKVVG